MYLKDSDTFISPEGISMCERLGDRCKGRIFGGPMRCVHGLRRRILELENELEPLRSELDGLE